MLSRRSLFAFPSLLAAATAPQTTENETEIQIVTDQLEAKVLKKGYVSGVAAGSFVDKRTGFRDIGFGLDIVDFILEPGSDIDYRDQLPKDMVYEFKNLVHGRIPKRMIEGPQICTQARQLSPKLIKGKDFAAVQSTFTYTKAAPGRKPGSRWTQTMVFPQGQRYFFSSDRIDAANRSEEMLLRIDLPGHIRHKDIQNFSEVYLSYHNGLIPASEFAKPFPPDEKFLYQRAKAGKQKYFIRGYHTRDPQTGKPGPWLAAIVLDPSVVYEAWCHERGYVCMILEIGGRPIKPGESFSAAYAVGFFDSIAEMEKVASRYAGKTGLSLQDQTWQFAR